MEAPGNTKMDWEVRGGIGYLTFTDEPENRMDSAFFSILEHLTRRVIPKSTFSAIIISGAGRHFSSGANLDELLQLLANKKQDDRAGALLANHSSFEFFAQQKVPVIAAIRGACLGSALELALQCHFRLCSPDAVFGLPESGFGLMPGIGGIAGLQSLAGNAKTIELVCRGNTFNASDALQWHIVDAVFAKKELPVQAQKLAGLAADNFRKYNTKDYIAALTSETAPPGGFTAF